MKKLSMLLLLGYSFLWPDVGLRVSRNQEIHFESADVIIQRPKKVSIQGILEFEPIKRINVRLSLLSFDFINNHNTFNFYYEPCVTTLINIPLSEKFSLLGIPDVKMKHDDYLFGQINLGTGFKYDMSERFKISCDIFFFQFAWVIVEGLVSGEISAGPLEENGFSIFYKF